MQRFATLRKVVKQKARGAPRSRREGAPLTTFIAVGWYSCERFGCVGWGVRNLTARLGARMDSLGPYASIDTYVHVDRFLKRALTQNESAPDESTASPRSWKAVGAGRRTWAAARSRRSLTGLNTSPSSSLDRAWLAFNDLSGKLSGIGRKELVSH
jgi:hypothetical protein